MTSWLTPIWLVGVGIALGFIGLGALLGVFFLISRIGLLEQLQKNRLVAHGVAFGLSVAIAFVVHLLSSRYFDVGTSPIARSESAILGGGIWLLCAVFSWALIFCPRKRFFGEMRSLFGEGVGAYTLVTLVIVSLSGLLSVVVVNQPLRILASLQQVFSTGTDSRTFKIDGVNLDTEEAELQKVDINYDSPRLTEVDITSDRNILIADAPTAAEFVMKPTRVEANSTVSWRRAGAKPPPIPVLEGAGLYIQNFEIDPATVTITWKTLPTVPQILSVVFIAAAVILLGVVFFLPEGISPRVSAIALASSKSEVSQPLFVILVLIGIFAIGLFVFMPFNTFGEDIKLMKNCGITTILVLSLVQGIWSASSSVSEEIEGRTALTVLSKPVGRVEFILGKMVGVYWIVLLMFIILGAVMLVAVAYKPLMEARENSEEQPVWQVCHAEMMSTIPGLAMGMAQAAVLCSLSVAIAVRVPQIANFTICFAIYLIGHLTESIVASSEGGFAITQFVGQLIAVVVPNFEIFSAQAAIDAGLPIPMSYLSGTVIYGGLFSLIFVFLGMLLFEDRDLA